MTTEQKAKAYDEALERAKKLQETCDSTAIVGWCEYIFHQLKESEDERVRKLLVEAVTQVLQDQYCSNRGVSKEKVVAWLEKQGKEDSSIQQAYEWGYTEGKRIERKHWVEKQKFSEDYNSIDPQFGKPIEQNPAWSEEDEEMFEYTINLLNYNLGCRKWLQSLKERYTWKPSDEEMRALEYIINNAHNTSYSCKIAKELLEQLKKLKGE